MLRAFLAALAIVSASLVAHAQTTPPVFSADGWRMLRWPMSIDDARAALTASHVAFTSDERTGMFPRAGTQFAEVSFSTLLAHDGDRDVRIEYENHHLHEVRVIARRPSRAIAEQELARLRRQWGEPASHIAVAGIAPGVEYTWSNATTRLVLFVGHVRGSADWLATEAWSPAVPWPSWR